MEYIVPFQWNDIIVVDVDIGIDIVVVVDDVVVGMDWMDEEPITDSGSCDWLYHRVNVLAQDLKAVTVHCCDSDWYSRLAIVHLIGKKRLPSKLL